MFCPKSTTYLPTATLEVFAVLQLKQLAKLPFELMAAVKNTTPRVGCAEPGVRYSGLNPRQLLSSSAFCALAAPEKTIPRQRRATWAETAKMRFMICLLGMLGRCPPCPAAYSPWLFVSVSQLTMGECPAHPPHGPVRPR